ncbi:MAG: SpoIIE family protein phosphatase [Acidobacteriota bacterium]
MARGEPDTSARPPERERLERRTETPAPGSGATAAGARLEVQAGDGKRWTVPLREGVTRLGRREDNDVRFLEMHVSKRHAEIRGGNGRHLIVDVGSKAGIYVNGACVKERVLEDGDVIHLGTASSPRLIFRRGAGPRPDPPSTTVLSALQASSGERSLENLARFLAFNRLLGGRFSLNEILENAVDMAIVLTGAERGFLIEGRRGRSLDFLVARGRGGRSIPEREIRVSETIIRDVLEAGQPRVVPDVLEDDALAGQKSIIALSLRSAAAVPLRRFVLPEDGAAGGAGDASVFGVLYLDSRERRERFTRIDRGILEAVARDVSSVIENARLLREAEKKREMDEEMARAREVQEALLPSSFRAGPHTDVAGTCIPCLDLGGDYVDLFELSGGRFCFVIADVSGKGMPAALMAAAVKGILASEATIEQPLERMLSRANEAVCGLASRGRHVTLFCGVLSPGGEFAFVNAGHPHPMVVGADGEVRTLSTGDMALGFLESHSYAEEVVRLRPGDLVALYTDGVTEAVDLTGEFFGESRLEAILRASRHLAAAEIIGAVRDEVKAFTGGRPARDAGTGLVLKLLGTGPDAARPGPGCR